MCEAVHASAYGEAAGYDRPSLGAGPPGELIVERVVKYLER